MYIDRMKGQDYIDKTREYLDYLEEHLQNVAKAFQEISSACDGMVWVGDDYTWHTLRHEVMMHDISKFSAEEFTQYRSKFCPIDGEVEHDFDNAWKHHQLKNTHHWQSIRRDKKYPGITEMDLVHMVIDWTAMGYKFGDTAEAYYRANADTISLTEDEIAFIEEMFERIRNYEKPVQTSKPELTRPWYKVLCDWLGKDLV